MTYCDHGWYVNGTVKTFAADDIIFDTERVSKVIYDLKGGKAPDLAGLTAEHLQRAHPVLPVILSKLFQLIVMVKHVPVWS